MPPYFNGENIELSTKSASIIAQLEIFEKKI